MTDLNAPIETWAQDHIKTGKRRAEALHEDAKAHAQANDPKWKDSQLMAPTSEWDRADREGICGTGARVFSIPSQRFAARFEMIDWSDG